MADSSDRKRLAVQINNHFAVKLYSVLLKGSTFIGNKFFCPASLAVGLGMTALGARTTTADAMAKSLNCKLDDRAGFHQSMSELRTCLNAVNDEWNKLDVANRLFIQSQFPVLLEFVGNLESFYEGKVGRVDFRMKLEEARKIMNDWVADKTKGKVTHLVQRGILDVHTKTVLLNAVMFKAHWEGPFHPESTSEATFHVNRDETIQVQLMKKTCSVSLGVSEELECQIVELPYIGHRIAMIIFLPAEIDGLKHLEQKLTHEVYQTCVQSLPPKRKTEVEIFLPKFKIVDEFELSKFLRLMGLSELLDPEGADLSGITGHRNLHLSRVIHHAEIEVKEDGVDPSSAGVGKRRRSIRKPRFIAIHPFMFTIHDIETRNILFMGRVTRPQSS